MADKPSGPRPMAQLVVQLMPDGDIRVQGPIEDMVLCYGLLEMGKDAIRAAAQQRQSPLLLPPSALVGRRPAARPAVEHANRAPEPERQPDATPDPEAR